MALVKNCFIDNDGSKIKCVVWDTKRRKWSAVNKVGRNKNDLEGYGTYQIVDKDSILMICRSTEENPTPVMNLLGVTDVRDRESHMLDNLDLCQLPPSVDVLGTYQNITQVLTEWMSESYDDETSYNIPAGIGWDGRLSLYDQRKQDRVKTLLYGVEDCELLHRLTVAALISSGKNIATSWDQAEKVEVGTVITNKADDNTTHLYSIAWFYDGSVITTCTDNVQQPLNTEVQPDMVKLLVGAFNSGTDGVVSLTRWSLYQT